MVSRQKNNAIRLASKFARLLAVRVTILTLISFADALPHARKLPVGWEAEFPS